MQVKLEDVFPMAAGQHMGSPFSHSAHIYQSRLVLTFTLSHFNFHFNFHFIPL